MAATPREVFEKLMSGIDSGQWGELHLLYAEDAVVNHPFDLPRPSQLRGRESLREHFAPGETLRREVRSFNVNVHETADPEVIVAEFDRDVHYLDTGRRFQTGYIFVMRVRDGLIVESRDYTNPAGHLIGAGMTAELTKLAEETAEEAAEG